ARSVAPVERDVEPLLGRALAQEVDVLAGEIEPRHLVAAPAETNQVRAGAAGDVDHRLDGPLGKAAEAVGEEVHLLLAVHVEGDLIVTRRRVAGHLTATWRSHVDRGRSRLGRSSSVEAVGRRRLVRMFSLETFGRSRLERSAFAEAVGRSRLGRASFAGLIV